MNFHQSPRFSNGMAFFRSFFLICCFTVAGCFLPVDVKAIIPPEFAGDSDFVITQNMQGIDLKGYVFVKDDFRDVNLSEADLRGVVFNQSQLQGADFRESDLEDVVAFASAFDEADLRGANLTNALLMQSTFSNAQIEGADFSNAVLDLIQQKVLCSNAQGVNPQTGIETSESLGCTG